MNCSLQDGYNLGWKLASVLRHQSHPSLLSTYDLERSAIAADLIAFDREFVKGFSSRALKAQGKTADDFRKDFIRQAKYTAGLTARYADSAITSTALSAQVLAPGLEVGMRFPSAQVVRLCDAKAMQVVKALPSDGRWRVVIFAGDIMEDAAAQRLAKVSDVLKSLSAYD